MWCVFGLPCQHLMALPPSSSVHNFDPPVAQSHAPHACNRRERKEACTSCLDILAISGRRLPDDVPKRKVARPCPRGGQRVPRFGPRSVGRLVALGGTCRWAVVGGAGVEDSSYREMAGMIHWRHGDSARPICGRTFADPHLHGGARPLHKQCTARMSPQPCHVNTRLKIEHQGSHGTGTAQPPTGRWMLGTSP